MIFIVEFLSVARWILVWYDIYPYFVYRYQRVDGHFLVPSEVWLQSSENAPELTPVSYYLSCMLNDDNNFLCAETVACHSS
jgi:hypothetical protein